MRRVLPVEAASRVARVVIGDGHPTTRARLRRILASEPDVAVVGEASTGEEVVDLCRKVRPSLALLGAHLPKIDGLTATEAIARESPATRVILVVAKANPLFLHQALSVGAWGYLRRPVAASDIVGAVRQALRGSLFART